MIQCEDISLSFAGHSLFENVSFSLQSRERCGLVGRNGSGKSTLMRIIQGEIEPDKGKTLLPKDYRIGYLQQHIRFTKMTLLEEAALGLREEEKDHLYKAEKILFGLGFTDEDLSRAPSEFSGGFHLRLHLAKVMVSEPNCLLLDEPTNYLDILSIRWLENFLQRWKGELILISHDREFMDSIITCTMGIHRGKLRKINGNTIDFYTQILAEEEVHEKTRIKLDKKRAHLQSYIDRFGFKASKAAQAQSKKKQIEKEPVLEKLNQISHLSFSFKEAPFHSKKMLNVNNLSFSYADTPLIKNMHLEMGNKERVAIIGKNGRGKSTLLRLFAEELLPDKGSVILSRKAQIGYFGQTHIQRLHPSNTIEEEIQLANPELKYTEVKSIAGLMMFSADLAQKRISVLSGGERSRVLLGKIIAKPCNLLLLDEPTHHLDMESIEALIDALEIFSGSVIIVTHSELILRRLLLDKVIVCESEEQKVSLGNYDDFLEKIGWEEEKKKKSKKSGSNNDREQRKLLSQTKKKIEKFEEKITFLEAEQEKDQKIIEKGKQTKELLEDYGQRQREIELLFAELDELYKLHDNLKDLL